MPIVHEGLAKEFEYVTKEDERAMILEQIEAGDALMQEKGRRAELRSPGDRKTVRASKRR